MSDNLTPPTLNPRAKYGLAGDVVNTLHPYNEGDEATLLAEYLTLFGGFLGLKPHFFIGRTPHYARLYVAVVGQSGASRKGTTFNLVRSVFELIDPKFLRANIRKNVGSDAGIVTAAINAVEYAQQTGRDDGRLIVVENEFVTLLAGGTLQRTSPMIRDAWDVSVLHSTVKRSRTADPVHLSIVGMITLDELRHLLPNARVQAQVSNGLFNRFLFMLAQESKQLRLDQMEIPENQMASLAADTLDALEFGWKQNVIAIEKGVIDAQYKWRQNIRKRREREVKKARIAVRMFDLLNRGETYLLRLALIYAILDGSPVIRFQHYMAAEALWEYVEGSVRYIFEMPELTSGAQLLLDALIEAGSVGLTGTQMYKVVSNNDYCHRALDELREMGKISESRERRNPIGRPTHVYRLAEYEEYTGLDVADLVLAEGNEENEFSEPHPDG